MQTAKPISKDPISTSEFLIVKSRVRLLETLVEELMKEVKSLRKWKSQQWQEWSGK